MRLAWLVAVTAVVTLFVDASPHLAQKKVKCKKLVHICQDGVTRVYPNPYNDCEFDLCPEDVLVDVEEEIDDDGDDEDYSNDGDDSIDDGDDDNDEDGADEDEEPQECKKVVHTCADGKTKVHPNPLNDCEFDPCPEDEDADDQDDLSIEDIIDVEVTPEPTPAKKDQNIDHDEDNWDPDRPTRPVTTIAPKTVEWKAIDASKAPKAVQEAVQQAFALYNTTQICDKLILFYDSIEAHNETIAKKHHKKAKKHQSFHLVVNVDCYLQGEMQVGGKFILNLEQHGQNEEQAYQLIECAHLESWGELKNWLAVRNNVGYCQTPAQKHKFDVQPLQYVNYYAKTLTLFDTVIRNKNYLAIVATIIGAVAAIIILVVFLSIQRRYCGYKKLKLDDGPSPDTVADDEIEIDVKLTPPSKRQMVDGTEKSEEGKFV